MNCFKEISSVGESESKAEHHLQHTESTFFTVCEGHASANYNFSSYKGVNRVNIVCNSYPCFLLPDLLLIEYSATDLPCHLYLQNPCIMKKMNYFFPLLFVCLDVCVVHAIRLAQLSPLLISHPFITLWGGGLIRACLLVLITLTNAGSLPWMSSFEGFESLGVLCFHFPVYITFLWVLRQSTVEELWGWHSWERVGGRDFMVLMLLCLKTCLVPTRIQ